MHVLSGESPMNRQNHHLNSRSFTLGAPTTSSSNVHRNSLRRLKIHHRLEKRAKTRPSGSGAESCCGGFSKPRVVEILSDGMTK